MSFFDDGEETAPRPSARAPRRRPPESDRRALRSHASRVRGGHRRGRVGADQHTLMVRRRVAAGVGGRAADRGRAADQRLPEKRKAAVAEDVQPRSQRARARIRRTGLAAAVRGAGGRRRASRRSTSSSRSTNCARRHRASPRTRKSLSVPGEMAAAQRDLLLALDLRVEGMTKLAAPAAGALGGQAKQASVKIAGDMEMFLASDVIYSQRVAPLIQQTLADDGITGLTTSPTRFLPNIGWLEASTVAARLTGEATASSTQSTQTLAGHHGSVLVGVSVGSNNARTGTDDQPHLERRRQPDLRGDRRRRRRIQRDERQGRRDRHGRGQAVQGLARDRQDRTGQDKRPWKFPLTGVPVGAAREDRSADRAGARRNEPRRHQAALPGDLRRIGRTHGRAYPPEAPATAPAANLWRWPHRSPTRRGIIAIAARPRLALVALIACVALSISVRRLRARAASGARRARRAGPRRARRRACTRRSSALRAYVEGTATRLDARLAAVETALRGRDRAPRAGALRRLQRALGTAVDVDRAARRRAVGHRAVVHPPSRPGARVRQAGARRARRARAVSGGGGGGARCARIPGAAQAGGWRRRVARR